MAEVQLCDLCKVVQINDAQFGGKVAYGFNDDGSIREYVYFEEEIESEESSEEGGDETSEDESERSHGADCAQHSGQYMATYKRGRSEDLGDTTDSEGTRAKRTRKEYSSEAERDRSASEDSQVSREPDGTWEEDLNLRELSFQRHIPYERQDTLPALPELSSGARSGCVFCGLLQSSIKEQLRKGSIEIPVAVPGNQGTLISIQGIHFQWHRCHRKGYPAGWWLGPMHLLSSVTLAGLVVDFAVGYPGTDFQHLYFETSAAPGSVATWLRIHREPPFKDPLSEEAVSRIKSMVFDDEVTSYVTNTTRFYPTRLIKVGGEKAADRPRLVLTQNEAGAGTETLQYSTLSYCWGKPDRPFFKTEKATFQERFHHIPLDAIPSTFQDAIMLSRRLGIRYLWIDALCIIQDDLQDWQLESSRMADIFQNSFLTIVAMRPSSCHERFLHSRTNAMVRMPFTSLVKSQISGTYTLRHIPEEIWQSRMETGALEGTLYRDEISDDPSRWSNRGWTMQEEFISPRKLYIGEHLFYYHTYGSTRSEDGLRTADENRFMGLQTQEMYETWDEVILSNYSDRTFTYPEDRLPALSGLAKIIQQRTGDEYVAGLWKSKLHRGLLWGTATPSRNFSELISRTLIPSPFIAPSWSPMREQMYVENNFWHQQLTTESEILNVETVPLGLDPLGRIQSGHLTIRAKSHQMRGGRIREDVLRRGFNFRFEIERTYIADCRLEWYDLEMDSDPGLDVSADLMSGLCMVLLSSVSDEYLSGYERGEGSNPNVMLGLILLPKGDGNEWFRVGMFQSAEVEGGGTPFFDSCETKTFKIV